MIFWIIAACLCLAASAFIAVPLLRSHKQAAQPPSHRQTNKRVIREQLAELNADLAAGKIDEPQLRRLQDELYAAALADDSQLGETVSKDSRLSRPKLTLASIAVVLSLSALITYYYLGYLADVRIAQQLRQPQTGELGVAGLQNLIPAFQRRLQRRPENSGYRYLLAQAQMQTQRYAEAAASYKELVALHGDDAQLWAYYAQALYMANSRRMAAEISDALARALELNPGQSTALGLQGMNAFEEKDYATAVKAWTGLLAGLPPGSEQANTINAALQRARALAGDPVPETTASASLRVNVAEDIETPMAGNTTVFVYARAVEGPKMPLAIQRLTLADLPASVELDDSMAMSPAMRLSSVGRVEIIARVSISGNATAQPGDWEARSKPLTTGQQKKPIELLITQQVQ